MRFTKLNDTVSRLFRRKQEDRVVQSPVAGRGLSAQDAKRVEEGVRRILKEHGDVLTRLAHE